MFSRVGPSDLALLGLSLGTVNDTKCPCESPSQSGVNSFPLSIPSSAIWWTNGINGRLQFFLSPKTNRLALTTERKMNGHTWIKEALLRFTLKCSFSHFTLVCDTFYLKVVSDKWKLVHQTDRSPGVLRGEIIIWRRKLLQKDILDRWLHAWSKFIAGLQLSLAKVWRVKGIKRILVTKCRIKTSPERFQRTQNTRYLSYSDFCKR